MKDTLLIILLLVMGGHASSQVKLLETPPRNYVVYRSTEPLVLDGKLDEPDWQNIPWTEDFLDIEGPHMPAPLYRTRAKMLWDDNYFYIAAELNEPHIWATYTERESIIFHENDFEVFIDPSGDTHTYYEFEINALGTIWDLMLTKPYLNDGLPITGWDISGFEFGIHKRGTINNAMDIDTLWTLEMAFPLKILAEAATEKRKPIDGDQWRINFSRVQWRLDVVDGKYQKTINPETGKSFPEFNWVWSPQWVIDMHRPQYWGYVQFSDTKAGEKEVVFQVNQEEKIKYLLRELYYNQLAFRKRTGHFASSLDELNPPNPDLYRQIGVDFEAGKRRFMMFTPSGDGDQYWYITDDSRIWKQ
jgi:hypothetical protein